MLTAQITDEPPSLINELHERIYVAFATRTANRTTFSKIHKLQPQNHNQNLLIARALKKQMQLLGFFLK